MSYKIEITAETITELTGKLLALAAATQPNDPVMPEVKEATKPKRAPKAAHVPSSGEAEAAAKDTEDKANPSEAAAEAAEPTTTSADTGNSAEQSSEATPSEEPTTSSEAAPEALDFDKDVAPVVLEAVKQRGKDWVSEILSQFGVARASQVADEQMGELVAALKEGLK